MLVARVGDTVASLLAALEQAIDAIVIIDADNNITHFNAAAEQMWGYDRDEVMGRNVKMLVPMAEQRHHDGYIAANRNGSASRIVGKSREVKIERKDGTTLWGSLSLSRVEIDGEVTYTGFVRDVTAEVERREQLALLSLVAAHTDRMAIVTDAQQHILYVNDSFLQIFGYLREEVYGRNPKEFLFGEYTDHETVSRLELQDGSRKSTQEEVLAYDKNGNEVWISATVNVVKDQNGNVQNLLAVFSDITQGKQIHSLQHHTLEALAHNVSIEEVLTELCRRVETIAPDVVASVLHVDAGGRLHPLGAPSLPADYVKSAEGMEIGPDVGSCGAAAFLGEAVLALDIETDPRWPLYNAMPLAAGLRACWSTPIKAKDGRVIGAFAFYFRERREPTRWHKTIVEACVHLCALAIERREARTEIARLAYYDTLTGLPNRAHLRRVMVDLIAHNRADQKIAVIFLDLDHFKDVNDTLGHSVGDELLVNVTRHLRAQVRPGDTVSRQGGDEFVIVLPNCDAHGASAIVTRILGALSAPIQLSDKFVPVSASIGISIYPDNADNIDGLLKHADAAMYSAKQAGRATYRLFNAEMNRQNEERLAFSTALRNAVLRGELKLHFQPQIRIADGGVYGLEALARWHDPVFGEVPPSKFIPLAEEFGLIGQIGAWSLREACRQIAAWRAAGLDVPCVSVNLSPINFQNDDLAELVADTIAEFDLPPHLLTLEITEGVVIGEHSAAVGTMQKIRKSGVGMSMDDFGTGYSSLSRLAHLPISELKIDRSFMCDIETDASALAIAKVIVRVGQSLNMVVVAEGVETEGQRRILAEIGCDVIQGFLYVKPLSASDLKRWLVDHEASCAVAKLRDVGGLAGRQPLLAVAHAGNRGR